MDVETAVIQQDALFRAQALDPYALSDPGSAARRGAHQIAVAGALGVNRLVQWQLDGLCLMALGLTCLFRVPTGESVQANHILRRSFPRAIGDAACHCRSTKLMPTIRLGQIPPDAPFLVLSPAERERHVPASETHPVDRAQCRTRSGIGSNMH